MCFNISTSIFGQFLEGQFFSIKNKEIILEGFKGPNSYTISRVKTNDLGIFKLPYTTQDIGVAILKIKDNDPYFLLLDGENTSIVGDSPSALATIKVIKGSQNISLLQYTREQPIREQSLGAWRFLKKNYTDGLLGPKNDKLNQTISEEIVRIKKAEQDFINNLPANSYLKWFLPTRKLIFDIKVIAQYYPEELQSSVAGLAKLNLADPRLYKSGLFKEAIENQFWILENKKDTSDKNLKAVNALIDTILAQLTQDEAKFNEVAEFLFRYLDNHDLYDSSKYLADKIANDKSCSHSDGVNNQLEKVRKMTVGSVQSDIEFGADAILPAGSIAKKISDLKSPYTLIIFAAGWCPHCTENVPKIAKMYPYLKDNGLEVVLVSLDDTKESFQHFASSFPFISTTDYGKWKSKAAKDYNVSSTPSYFILDQNQKLVLRPRNAEHILTWLKEIEAKK